MKEQSMPSKIKVYFLHNIDGRRWGMIAANSKKQVRQVINVPASEIGVVSLTEEERHLALSSPGVLFVQPIAAHNSEWTRSKFPAIQIPPAT